MAIFLLLIGLLLVVTAIRGTQSDFFDLLKNDFSGQNNFVLWSLAFVFLVSLGYIKAIKPVTNAFMWLLLVVIFLGARNSNKDIFGDFVAQVKEGTS